MDVQLRKYIVPRHNKYEESEQYTKACENIIQRK